MQACYSRKQKKIKRVQNKSDGEIQLKCTQYKYLYDAFAALKDEKAGSALYT